MNVEELDGVGPTLAAAIRRRFKEDARFEAAAMALDLEAIGSIDGVSPRRAIELVRQVTGTTAGDRLLATPATRKVHEDIMGRIQRFAATQHGKNRLALLAPVTGPDEARKRMAHVMEQKRRVQGMDRATVRRHLRSLRPLAWPSPVCDTTTLVIAGSDAAYERLHGLGVGRWCYLGSPRDAASSDAELTILAQDGGHDVPADVEVSGDADLADVAPQAWLAWARHNQATLRACQGLAALTGAKTRAGEALDALESAPATHLDPRDLRNRLDAIRQDLDVRLEAELDRLALPATQLMRALSQNQLPPDVKKLVDAAIRDGARQLREQTGLAMQPFCAAFPVTIDEDEVERIVDEQRSASRAQAFQAAQKRACIVQGVQEAVAAEVAAWLEFDADFALGCFAHHHDLQPPTFGDRFHIERGIHLALSAEPGMQRVTYTLGDPHRIAVLTGANSGGKSTLLEQLTQIAVMARMGLPVVGDVTLPWFDEVHLVTARRGLDAGAFETFLRGFLPIADGDARRLVLADEVESVTELEAAGRILAFFLDRLASTPSMTVLVTHMAKPILQHATADIRIDGIEATGLDEDDELIVDRCPKMGRFARSTPELIVQRLAKTCHGDMQRLFRDLHQHLLGPKNA